MPVLRRTTSSRRKRDCSSRQARPTREPADSITAQVGAYLDITLKGRHSRTAGPRGLGAIAQFWIRIGYTQLRGWDGQLEDVSEHRGVLQLTVRGGSWKDFQLTHRLRMDYRDLNGTTSQRYRYRLNIEREFTYRRYFGRSVHRGRSLLRHALFGVVEAALPGRVRNSPVNALAHRALSRAGQGLTAVPGPHDSGRHSAQIVLVIFFHDEKDTHTPFTLNDDQTRGGYARLAALIAKLKAARQDQGLFWFSTRVTTAWGRHLPRPAVRPKRWTS